MLRGPEEEEASRRQRWGHLATDVGVNRMNLAVKGTAHTHPLDLPPHPEKPVSAQEPSSTKPRAAAPPCNTATPPTEPPPPHLLPPPAWPPPRASSTGPSSGPSTSPQPRLLHVGTTSS